MVVFVHVLIAFFSLVWVGFTYFTPTKLKLRVSYILITLIALSGIYLIFETKSNILRSCLSGLAFVVLTTIVTRQAGIKYRKLESVSVLEN